MSAIKKSGLKTLIPVLLLLIFFSCDPKKGENSPSGNSDEIISIDYSDIGGEAGNYTIVKITKDSARLETGVTQKKIHKEWKSAITPKAWQNLTSAIDATTLDKIRSSPSKQPVDGFDETFQIRTRKKYHAYVNAYADTVHYRQLEKLKASIQNMIPQEYK